MKQNVRIKPVKVRAYAAKRNNGAALHITVSHGCISKTASKLIKF